MRLSTPVPSATQQQAASSHADAQFKVTAIGSCRVAGPLRRASQSGCFTLNQAGVYGYCHSSAEALQQIEVLQTTRELPEHLLPVVAPNHVTQVPGFVAHQTSDLYFVELSSAKVLSVDGICVQLNYLTRHLEAFFSDRLRARAYWQAVRQGDRAARQHTLSSYGAATRLDDGQRHILDALELRMSDEISLARDIDAICDRVPDVLFVTHFNARKHDGSWLHSRETYIETAKRALKDTNARYFDPSDYVEAFGQDDALQDPEGSLSHYSEAFETYLCQNWISRYIKPLAQMRRRAAPVRDLPIAANA